MDQLQPAAQSFVYRMQTITRGSLRGHHENACAYFAQRTFKGESVSRTCRRKSVAFITCALPGTWTSVRVGVVGACNHSCTPTKPSIPINPVSPESPSLIS